MNSSRERERLARQKKQQRRRRRQIMIIIVELFLLVIVGACCYVVSAFNTMKDDNGNNNQIYIPSFGTVAENDETKDETENESNGESVDATEDETEDETETVGKPAVNYNTVLQKYWNIAFVGLDSRAKTDSIYDKPRSDVIIICSINRETYEVKLVSVYRDTYMKIEDTGNNYGYNKVNSAYSSGDIYTTISTLNKNLDLTITDYAIVDWTVVAKCINSLGGITAELTDDFIHKAHFNSLVTEIVENTGIPSHQIWKPGVYTLDGVQAVAYCRMRYSDSDYHRTERQRQVIEQMFQKVQSEVKRGNVGLMLNIVNDLTQYVRFSLDMSDIYNILINASSYKIVGQSGYPYTKVDTQTVGKIDVSYPVVPINVEKNVKQLHEFLFGENGYQPTTTVKEISTYIRKISGVG